MPPPPVNVFAECLHVAVPCDAIRGWRANLAPNDAMRDITPSGDDASQAVSEAACERWILESGDHATRFADHAAAVYSVEL
jgi:hypothetical protein